MNPLRRIFLLVICASSAVLMQHAAYAASPKESVCIGGDEQLTAKTWGELYKHWMRYAACDDGGLGELYSDKVVNLLTTKWNQVAELASLAVKHPKFGQFVLRHVDDLMSPDEARVIQDNAKERCPKSAASLCRQILDQLAKDPS